MRIILFLLILVYSGFSFAQVNIDSYEYWFNNDFGNKVNISVAPQNTLNLNTSFSTANLSYGVHSFNIRFKDNNNLWSSVESNFFLKLAPQVQTNREIIAYEYWLDNDYSNSIFVNTTPTQTINISELLDFTSLSSGVHIVNIRFKDNTGLWSSVESNFFLKLAPQIQTNREIIAYEYWLGNDYSNAVLVNTTPTQVINLNQLLDFSTVNNGLHSFNIRFKDNTHLWSSVSTQFIFKLPAQETIENKITNYRYWLDNDFANAVETFTDVPVEQFVLIDSLDFTQIPKGHYEINFQFQDSLGLWSSVVSDSIEKVSLPIAHFDYVKTAENCDFTTIQFTNNSIDGDEYLWDFGDGNQSTDENPTHTFSSTGTYTVSLYIQDTITGADSVFIQSISIIGETYGTLTETECDSYTSPSGNILTVSGIYSDTLAGQNIFNCDSIITINLTINYSASTFETETSCNPADTGIFVFNGQTVLNCDSTHTLTVTLLPSHETFETLTSCNPSDTSVVVLNLENQFLCDSTHTITTTFEEWDVDVSVSVSNNVLSALQSGLSYQWINCDNNQAIPGATAQSFTATANGSYAVQFSENGCQAISDCYTITGVGIKDDLLKTVSVYPNPTNKDLNIDLRQLSGGVHINVYNLTGNLIDNFKTSGNTVETIHINAAAGVYLIEISSKNHSQTFKIIKY